MKEPLFKNRSFIYFLSAQSISQLGDWIHWVTILAFVYDSTHSGLALASVPITLTITRIAVAPFAGVLVDRYNRKKIMIVTNIGQALLVCLFLFDAVLRSLAAIILVTMSVSILSSIHEPTKQCVIPMIVKKEDMLKANSLMQAIMNSLWVFGPIMGGGLIVIFGFKFGFLFNAITFLVSGLLIQGVKLGVRQEKQCSMNFIKEMRVGVTYVRKNRIASVLIISTFIVMLGGGSVNALMASLPNDVYHVSTKIGYAVLLSFTGIGWVVGSYVLARYAKKVEYKKTKFSLWFIAGTMSGLTVLLVVQTDLFLVGCMAWLSHGIFNSTRDILETTIIQETVSEEFMGRIFAFQGLLIEVASIISISIGGILLTLAGIKTVFSFAGIMEIISVVFGFFLLYKFVFNHKKTSSTQVT